MSGKRECSKDNGVLREWIAKLNRRGFHLAVSGKKPTKRQIDLAWIIDGAQYMTNFSFSIDSLHIELQNILGWQENYYPFGVSLPTYVDFSLECVDFCRSQVIAGENSQKCVLCPLDRLQAWALLPPYIYVLRSRERIQEIEYPLNR